MVDAMSDSKPTDFDDVEITPEMITAGRSAMREFYDDELIEVGDSVLIAVFREMVSACRLASAQ